MQYKDFFKEVCGLKSRPKVSNVDPKTLADGIAVEKEHTNDEEIAKTIALKHIQEDPLYYKKLKKAGLADELKDESLSLGGEEECPCNDDQKKDINNIDYGWHEDELRQRYNQEYGNNSSNIDTPEMVVGIGGSEPCDIDDTSNNTKTDVEKPATDPTTTDHVTGGINKTPENPNILSKDGQQPVNNSEFATFDTLKSIGNGVIPKDISIDIAESKKVLSKMMKDTLTSYEKDVNKDKKTIKKEGYGGDPSTDDAYVKGKRWTVKWK